MTSPDMHAAREDVLRARAELSDTLAQLSDRITSPINAAKQKLDLVQAARNNPWSAIALAIGAGAFLSATGSDARIAASAVQAGKAGAESARDTAQSTADYATNAARTAPSMARRALGDAADALATKGLVALIAALSRHEAMETREAPAPAASRPTTPPA